MRQVVQVVLGLVLVASFAIAARKPQREDGPAETTSPST